MLPIDQERPGRLSIEMTQQRSTYLWATIFDKIVENILIFKHKNTTINTIPPPKKHCGVIPFPKFSDHAPPAMLSVSKFVLIHFGLTNSNKLPH